MSELKAFDVIINDDYKTKCYMKADADKALSVKDAEIRRLKRALYKAFAMWANLKKWDALTPSEKWEMWDNVSKKCRAMAEKFKEAK